MPVGNWCQLEWNLEIKRNLGGNKAGTVPGEASFSVAVSSQSYLSGHRFYTVCVLSSDYFMINQGLNLDMFLSSLFKTFS